MTEPVIPAPTGYRDAIKSFTVNSAARATVKFTLYEDYGLSFSAYGDRPGQYGWINAGIDKLIAAGFWHREFSRGKYGSPDAKLKAEPPTVAAMMAMSIEFGRQETPAPQASALPSSSLASLVPDERQVAAPAAGELAVMSPDQVAASVNEMNRRLHRR